jgi:hypothetical protein
MTRKSAVAIGVCLALLAAPALAQSPPPDQPPEAIRRMIQDWDAMQAAQRHFLDSLTAVLRERDTMARELAAAKAGPPPAQPEKKDGK